MDNIPIQETTSTYYNAIVRKEVCPMTVEDLTAEVVDYFNGQIRIAFTDEGDQTVERVRYLIPYILQSIDWDTYGIPLEAWQLRYYYQRERFFTKTRLSYDTFMAHAPLQEALKTLKLDPVPTFEFILFLKYYYTLRSELRYSAVEQLSQALKAIENLAPGESASIDISVAGRHYKINNTSFVKQALRTIPFDSLNKGAFANDFNEGGSRDKIRALDYYVVKTLLDYLPMKDGQRHRGKYSQAQRNFSLSVLSYLGRLPDIDREGECSKENNATFDKLMRDFKGVSIPFAMELFL